ncbi:MAG: hypothetical protein HZB62_09200 [Nitrospirae bacterium]|nr:hypothetical protein [Nitrospirota bacterium]
MHRRLCNYDNAMKDLSAAIQLAEANDNFALSRRAAVYIAIGDIVAARADLARVKEVRSENVAVLYNQAVAFSLEDQPSEAIDLLRRAIKISAEARHYAVNDDLFDPLRNMPEFHELINVHRQAEIDDIGGRP